MTFTITEYNQLKVKISLLKRARVRIVNYRDGYERRTEPIHADDNEYLSESLRRLGKMKEADLKEIGINCIDAMNLIQEGRILSPVIDGYE